jgi:hypothetical protein
LVDIFDEVDEELRAEKAEQLLKRYSGALIGAALVVLAGAGSWQGWQWWQARQDAAAAGAFVAAVSAADAATGLDPSARSSLGAAFDSLAAGAPEGYRTLARLRSAALKAQAGDLNGAAMLWDQVAADGAADPLLRDLATLMWAQWQIDQGDPARLEARLKPLTDPVNAWRALAQEQLALLDLRQGHADRAKATFAKLSQDVTAPVGVRSRASALLSRFGS